MPKLGATAFRAQSPLGAVNRLLQAGASPSLLVAVSPLIQEAGYPSRQAVDSRLLEVVDCLTVPAVVSDQTGPGAVV
jgi:hypothetical protein